MKQTKKSQLSTVISWVKSHRLETFFIVGLLLLASFLRLYNIRNTVIFLGDEGRDALAVKRIVVDLDPTLLGPTASVGGFYLGPVYYYMIAPFMLLFGMDPVGGAVMVALMGVAAVALIYWLLRQSYGVFTAGLVSLLYAVSPGLVRFSRSSWNPNPMPLFSLLAITCFYLGIKSNRLIWFFSTGVALGIIIQLHYLGLIMCGIIGLMILMLVKLKNWFKTILVTLIGFLVGASMFFAFELRHGFLNTKAVLEFISRAGSTTGPRSWNPFWLFYEMNRFNLEGILDTWSAPLTMYLTILLLLGVLLAGLYRLYTNQKFDLLSKVILLYWIIGTIGLGFYRGQQYYHYFQLLYPAPFLVLGFVLSQITSKYLKIGLGVAGIAFSGVLLTKVPTWEEGSRLLDQTERVADKVIELAQDEPYNFALITDGNSDHAYRFYLEIKDKKPIPLEERVTSQLLIVCEKWPEKDCAPLGNPLWEVAGFGRAEIEAQDEVYPRITIYRMGHHQDSLDKIGKPAKQGG